MADRGCKELTDPDVYELVVVECDGCSFHLGVDASWLAQTYEKGLEMKCPCCNQEIFIEATN